MRGRSSVGVLFVYLLYLASLIIAGVAAIAWPSSSLKTTFALGYLASSVAALVLLVVTAAAAARRTRVTLRVYVCALLFPHRKVRVSMAHLFRVTIDGSYLLMTNVRHGDICPVGGAYKHYDSAEQLFTAIHAIPDIVLVPGDDPNRYECDLRKLLPMKHFRTFLNWFDAASHREWDPLRGFHSSLTVEGFIDGDVFQNIHYWRFATEREFSKYDKQLGRYEFHHFDVFAVELDSEQKRQVLNAVNGRRVVFRAGMPVHLYLASEQEILERQLSSKLKVGKNAKYIL